MFWREELAIIRSNLTAERIAVWIKDPNILDVKTIDYGAYNGRLGIVANSLLKALKTNPHCAELKSLSTSETFTWTLCAHLLHEVVPAVRNLRIGGTMVPQLLVLPAGTVAEPESLANALSLGDVPHGVAKMEGYRELSRKKVKVDLEDGARALGELLDGDLHVAAGVLEDLKDLPSLEEALQLRNIAHSRNFREVLFCEDCNSGVAYVGWFFSSPFRTTVHCPRCRKEGPPGAELVCFLPRFKLHKLARYLEAAKRQPQLNTIRGRPLGIVRPVKMAGYCLDRGEQELTKECLVAKIELIEANTLLEVLKEHAGEAAIAGLAVAGGPDEPARQKRRAEEVVRLAIEGKGASCISFNLRSSAEWGSKLAQVCERQRADKFHFEYTSRPSTTRVMIGNIGKGMGWRVDRTEARSIALGVSGVQSQSLVLEWGALALWFMIGPHLVAEADEWIRTHTDHKNGFKDLDHANQLEDSEWESLWRCLFAADGNYAGAFDAFTVHQYAGEMVCVPPGWLYAVRILQPCLQLEWSFIDPVNFVQYVRSERLVCRPFTVSPRDNIVLQYELWYKALSK